MVLKIIFLSAVGDGSKKFKRYRRQRLKLFSDDGDSTKKYKSAIFKP